MVNGWLLSRDTIIAEIKDNKVIPIKSQLLPFWFQNPENSLDRWLRARMMDTGRANSRLLRKALSLGDAKIEEAVLSVNAAAITDTYWIRQGDSNIVWNDVRFRQNEFASVALLGAFSDLGKPFSRTPELTNTGSFEKCWRLEADGWWLYKIGEPENLFSEIAAYEIGKMLGYPMARYELVSREKVQNTFSGKLKGMQGVIRTKDFTNGEVIFEPGESLSLRNSDVNYNYEKLYEIRPTLAEQYVQIVTLDALIFNPDRHAQNFGVLRDIDTGDVLSLAPNYDNNLSLLSGGLFERSMDNDSVLVEWRSLVHGQLLSYSLPPLERKELDELLQGISCGISSEEIRQCANFIMQGYKIIEHALVQIEKLKGKNRRLDKGHGMER